MDVQLHVQVPVGSLTVPWTSPANPSQWGDVLVLIYPWVKGISWAPLLHIVREGAVVDGNVKGSSCYQGAGFELSYEDPANYH